MSHHLVSFLLCLAGFAGLALATVRQGPVLLARPLPEPVRRGLQIAGAGALAAALVALVSWQGWGSGLVAFSGHTSLAAGFVYCVLIVLARCEAVSSD